MPRGARKRSETGLYHVMIRGADRRIIFADDEDHRKFLHQLRDAKEKSSCKLYAYCLMGNHVHLLIKEEEEALESIMKRLGVAYVSYYNWKYQLTGHLFQDRYRSEAIESDACFLDVLRYIWQNPVKAGLCESAVEYKWLGCSGIRDKAKLTDPISDFSSLSDTVLREFVNEPCERDHLEDNGAKRLTDQEAIRRLCRACGSSTVQEIGGWQGPLRDQAIRLGIGAGLSIRQLSRLTGISKTSIERVIRCK